MCLVGCPRDSFASLNYQAKHIFCLLNNAVGTLLNNNNTESKYLEVTTCQENFIRLIFYLRSFFKHLITKFKKRGKSHNGKTAAIQEEVVEEPFGNEGKLDTIHYLKCNEPHCIIGLS